MLFNFIFNSFTGVMLMITFMFLNIISFIIFLLCDEENFLKYDKIIKFIEPIGVLFGCVILCLASLPLFMIFIYNAFGMLINIAILIFEFSIWSSIISYFILRFFPTEKLNLLIKKLLRFSLLVAISINVILIIFLISTPTAVLLPISVIILYLKTLSIVRKGI